MAKKSTHKDYKKSSFLGLPFLAGILVVIGVVAAIYLSMNNSAVKGTSIFKPPVKISSDSATESAKRCKARVVSFSLTGVCSTSSDRNKFTTVNYTCSDGTTGSIQKDCLNAGDAFAKANIACVKSECPRPSISPKPIRTIPPRTTNSTNR